MAISSEQISSRLAGMVRGDVSGDIFNRAAYSTDASIYQIMPACIVWPRDAKDIAAVVKYARKNDIAVIARGAGSGVAGEAIGSGIIIDVTRYMNKILSFDAGTGVVVCQPGVVLDDLNNYLADFDVKIGPDPSSSNRAVIGGVVANNATGAHSLEYGYIADHVESINAVLADGSIVKFTNGYLPMEDDKGVVDSIAAKCISLLSENSDVIAKALPVSKRNRSGYNIAGVCDHGRMDMARVLTGSEGTLAIFTEIALKTVEVWEAKALLQLGFDSFEMMAKVVPVIVDSGVSACELLDRSLIKMTLEAYPSYSDIFPGDAEAVLLVEHVGTTHEVVAEKIQKTDSAVGELASGRATIFDPEAQERLWKSRKDAVGLVNRQKGGKHPIPFVEDVSVDNTCLGEYIEGLDEIGRRYDIAMSYYGHAGDGELHVRPYLDLSDADDVAKMRSIANDVFALAWSLGGTISGEHADGLVRAGFLKRQYGPEYYKLLKQIKNIFDPDNILNPGKILNDAADVLTCNLRAEHRPVAERLKTNLLFGPDEFRLAIEQCNGDGVCRSTQPGVRMCPVYRAMPEELCCSRAKANLLRCWITGLISDTEFESREFKQIIQQCVNCKMCSVECPSGVDVSKLIVEARTEYARRKGLTRAETALSNNRYMSLLGSVFSPLSDFFMSLVPFKWFLEKVTGLDSRRGFPRFQRGSFLEKGRKYLGSCEAIAEPVDKVAYFVDSFANYNDHKLGFAVIKFLRHNNIDVILPEQLPAPITAIAYGDIKRAKKDLSFIVSNFASVVRAGFKIVCSEPSAALCLKDELKYFIDGDDADLVSENSFELMGYLLGLYRQGKLKSPKGAVSRSFAYYEPCHLCALGGDRASAELLNGLCSLQVTNIEAGCCGLAGTFGMQRKNRELSKKISEPFVEALNQIEEKYVITECSACKMQIEQLTGKKALHPVKVLGRAYGLI